MTDIIPIKEYSDEWFRDCFLVLGRYCLLIYNIKIQLPDQMNNKDEIEEYLKYYKEMKSLWAEHRQKDFLLGITLENMLGIPSEDEQLKMFSEYWNQKK